MDEFLEALQCMETEDEEGALIIRTLLDLHGEGRFQVRDLTTSLNDWPGAMKRVIALVADPRKTDPRTLVTSALDSMAERQRRKEFERIKYQRNTLLKEAGAAEADRLLEEINRKLKYRNDSGRKPERT